MGTFSEPFTIMVHWSPTNPSEMNTLRDMHVSVNNLKYCFGAGFLQHINRCAGILYKPYCNVSAVDDKTVTTPQDTSHSIRINPVGLHSGQY